MKRLRLPIEPWQALQLAGLVAAMVLAGVLNVLAARHFTRWDWTTAHRWTLSPATVETLRSLDQPGQTAPPVEVWAIAGQGDAFQPSLEQLLVAYEAESSRLLVRWIDPDRDVAKLVDLQHRFGLEAGRSEEGRVTTDAVVIVASGDKHWFLTPQDLFEQSDETHVRPDEERALTQAIRHVLGGERAKLCFTEGHGELSIDAGRDDRESLGVLRDLLDKNNYDLASVDTTGPGAHEPYEGCAVVVLAGPSAPFAPDETNRLRTWLMQGGSMLAVVGPIGGNDDSGMQPAGLDDALAPFGLALDDALVHDTDPSVSIPETNGEGFLVALRPHDVTAGLATSADAKAPHAVLLYARSLRHVAPPGAAPASELAVTTAGAYAKKSIRGASAWKDAPPREGGDPAGPFVVAMASERPRVTPTAPRGPRVVVIGSRFALADDNWRQPRAMHGTAFLVENALSWLAARPVVVDVPPKPEVTALVRVSAEARDEVRRYVLVLMPLAALLLGVAVWAWRRAAENKAYVPGGHAREAGDEEPRT
jgi:hypothetical protein